jgi:ABC-type branched-subunit amino acid transport system substrate-binding protein
MAVLATGLGVSMVVAACGSSSKKATGTTAAGSATSAAPSGPPIKLGLITTVQGTVTQPWILQSAKLGAAAVNAAGGIQGRPVEIDFCDDHTTTQGAALCAQKLLVQDKVLMLVGDDGVEEAPVVPVLASTGTMDWATLGASLDALKSPYVYVLQPVLVQYYQIPKMMAPTTKTVAYFVAENAIAQQSAKVTQTFFPKSVQITTVTVPLAATAFQTPCLQAKQLGADTAIVAINPGQIAQLISTCNQIGLTGVTWIIPSVIQTPEVVQTIGNLHLANLVPLSYSQAAYDAFNADLAKYGAQVGGVSNTYVDTTIGAWLGVKLVPRLVQGAGSLDPAKLKAWVDQQTAFDTNGATPPIDFTKTPLPPTPRIKNLSPYQGEVQGTKLVQTVPTPFTFTPGG